MPIIRDCCKKAINRRDLRKVIEDQSYLGKCLFLSKNDEYEKGRKFQIPKCDSCIKCLNITEMKFAFFQKAKKEFIFKNYEKIAALE